MSSVTARDVTVTDTDNKSQSDRIADAHRQNTNHRHRQAVKLARNDTATKEKTDIIECKIEIDHKTLKD